MTRKLFHIFSLFSVSALAFGLTGCATDYGDTGSGYAAPDPLEKQMELQEGMSRVTRSLTPF